VLPGAKEVLRTESPDVEVTREDQTLINQFSFLNNKMHELSAELKGKQSYLDGLNDAETELMLQAGDGQVKYQIGEVYIDLEQKEAESRLQSEQTRVKSEIESLQKRIESIKQILAEHKVKLYNKFGSNINLEEE